MRLFLSLPVVLVALWLVSEGPAPAQAAPDLSSTLEGIPDKLKELPSKLKEIGKTLGEGTRSVVTRIKESEITTKARNWFHETLEKMKEKWRNNF
ncbi:apolipoprotein C-I [Sorex araneus]|uniref:apolipoprotein C-I n=1 Tax=Sorex araneus TaxID=42254 RepID=UPI0003317BBB|nr:apolipoprotein C-I [Sorex araneus]